MNKLHMFVCVFRVFNLQALQALETTYQALETTYQTIRLQLLMIRRRKSQTSLYSALLKNENASLQAVPVYRKAIGD